MSCEARSVAGSGQDQCTQPNHRERRGTHSKQCDGLVLLGRRRFDGGFGIIDGVEHESRDEAAQQPRVRIVHLGGVLGLCGLHDAAGGRARLANGPPKYASRRWLALPRAMRKYAR